MTRVLVLFDRLAGLLERAGVDYPQFRAILGTKLLLDGRRGHGWFETRRPRSASQTVDLGFLLAIALHTLLGVGIGIAHFVLLSPFTAMTLVFGVVTIMLTFDLVADYSSVLLDTRDGPLLGPRPVTARTILFARLAHVAVYVTIYVGALGAATALTGTVRWGLAFLPAYLLGLTSSIVLVVAVVGGVYALLMRLVSRERLDDLVLVAQVAMTILTVGGYWAVTMADDLGAVTIESGPWLFLLPPAWMASVVQCAIGDLDSLHLMLASLAVLGPIAAVLVVARLAPAFDPEGASHVATTPGRASGRLARRTAEVLARGPVERAAFDLVWTLSARDRAFKLRTYPALAAVLFFALALLAARAGGAWGSRLADPFGGNLHVFLLYYTLAVLPTPLLMLPYSDDVEAAWAYRAAPLPLPGVVLWAALLVVLVRHVAPIFALVAAAIVLTSGLTTLPDVLLAGAVLALTATMLPLWLPRALPFSRPPPSGRASSTVGIMFGYLGVVLLLGGAHAFLTTLQTPIPQPWPRLLAIPICLLPAWRAARAYGATSWEQLPPA